MKKLISICLLGLFLSGCSTWNKITENADDVISVLCGAVSITSTVTNALNSKEILTGYLFNYEELVIETDLRGTIVNIGVRDGYKIGVAESILAVATICEAVEILGNKYTVEAKTE